MSTAEQTFDTEGDIRQYVEDHPSEAVKMNEYPFGRLDPLPVYFGVVDGEFTIYAEKGGLATPRGDDHQLYDVNDFTVVALDNTPLADL